MTGFNFGGILQAVAQMAPIAAELLPQIIGDGSGDVAGDGPVSIGLVDFLADAPNDTVYAVNNTTEPLSVSFQKAVVVADVPGMESILVPIGPRAAAQVTSEMSIFGDTGAVSAVPADATALVTPGPGNPTARQFVQYLPLLTATAFAAFGGKIYVKRQTINTPSGSTAVWTLGANSRLTDVFFNYGGPNGRKIDFRAHLRDKETKVGSGDYPYNYDVPMPDDTAVSAPLSDFNMTLLGDEAEMVKLAGPDRSIPIDELPDTVRLRVRSAA